MSIIIPVKYVIDDSKSTKIDSPWEYFFNSAIANNPKEFTPIGISGDTINIIKDAINAEKSHQKNNLGLVIKDENILEKILPSLESINEQLSKMEQADLLISNFEPKCLIVRWTSNCFWIIAKDEKAGTKMTQFIKEKFNHINQISKDFGLSLKEVFFGSDYAIDQIKKNTDISKEIKLGNPKNKFEEEVIKTISKITTGFLSNVEIFFEKPSESFEYDIIIPTNKRTTLDIEITNYKTATELKHLNSETLKSQLILSTFDKARRLDAEPIIILKGFPEQIFEQMNELATSRNITLLSQYNYKEKIEKIIFKKYMDVYLDRGENSFRDYFSRPEFFESVNIAK